MHEIAGRLDIAATVVDGTLRSASAPFSVALDVNPVVIVHTLRACAAPMD